MRKIVLLLAFVALLLTGCSSENPQNIDQEASQEDSAQKTVFVMAGKIESGEKADVTSKISAKVAEIKIDVGSVVKKGDPLIILDTKETEAQVTQARAGVSTAEANLAKTEAGARPEQKAQAQAALDSATVSYENAKSTYERNKDLFDSGAISEAQLESSQTLLAAAQAQYNSAKDNLDMLTKGETKETLNVLQSQVKQAQAVLESAESQLANGTITSPVSGVVSVKNISVGELATPGVLLVSIVNTDSLNVNASLPTGFLEKVQVGQEVVVKVAELPEEEFAGVVDVISPIIDAGSKNVSVKVKLENPKASLKPGMFAEVGFKN
ncbi:MAG: efflux RND transporter periplasmic adaptor subunit [Dehalobacterium sp.]